MIFLKFGESGGRNVAFVNLHRAHRATDSFVAIPAVLSPEDRVIHWPLSANVTLTTAKSHNQSADRWSREHGGYYGVAT